MDVTGNKTEMVNPERFEGHRGDLSLGAMGKAESGSAGVPLTIKPLNEFSPNVKIQFRNSHMGD
jgi:hypothetical protein